MTFLLPDPTTLRAAAGRIDAAAHAVRARADRLGLAVAATGWQGPAARAFGTQADVALGGLRTASGRLADAADALRRHADQVDVVVTSLLGIVRAGQATLADLLALPGGVLGALPAGVDEVVAAAGGVVTTVGGVADSVLDAVGLG